MHGRTLITLLIALTLAAAASAEQCPTTLSAGSDGGKAWLGINASGFVAGEGQSFEMPCGGAFYGANLRLVLDGTSWYGVPPLASGDVLYCRILKLDGSILASTTTVIGFNIGSQTVHFDFTAQGLNLTAGEYLIACFPAGARQGRLAYYQQGDIYAGGQRFLSENGGAGPWIAIPVDQGDLAFQVFMEGSGVPNENTAWSAVKTYYR
jgi:hypothetical protein